MVILDEMIINNQIIIARALKILINDNCFATKEREIVLEELEKVR